MDSPLSLSDTAAQPAAKVEEPAVGGADADASTPTDTIGIVTIHDGAPLESGEIIAPEVRGETADHNYFQDPESLSSLGWTARKTASGADRRHVLHQPLVRHG